MEIEEALAARETRYVILNLRRINEIDSTGALALLEINALLAARQMTLCVVVGVQSVALQRLKDFGVLGQLSSDRIFTDVDRAIEQAEDDLLSDQAAAVSAALPLAEVGALMNFSEHEIAVIASCLDRVEKAKGSVIFQEGEPGYNLLMITKGTASAYLRLANDEQIRLATFGPGTIFGELALLDQGLRSATVVADDVLICYSLSTSDFERLATEAPSVAIKLLAGLGRELSGRLRVANRTIQQLEL
jgi:CRP-like cAMP-binding protein